MQFNKNGRLWNSDLHPGAKPETKSEVCATTSSRRDFWSLADSCVWQ